ncbi:MAG: AMP-binding protein [Kiritimatiellae bacterium]|nr:AMP-binding protein [Kiritimatiellia bacterium]
MTIRTLLLDAAAQSPDSTAVRWKAADRQWHVWTFADLLARARAVSEALGALGVKPGDRVALMMENRPEWMAAYLGISSCGITAVPVDSHLHAHEVSHILRDSEAVAFVGSGRTGPLVREIMGTLKYMRHVVLADGAVAEERRESGVRLHDFDRLLAATEADSAKADSFFDRNVAAEGDVASIIYTSGTTGRSKGAMLTHGNFCAQLQALKYFTVRKDDNFLLVLPLHHAFAFTANFVVPLAAQCEISIVENLRTIPDNMRETRPTVLLAVPLLAEKMLGAIRKKLQKSAAARTLLSIGLHRVVGRKVIAGLGGRLRIIICGGAASDPDVLRAWSRFGVNTLQGYGLTETAPICALAPEDEIKFESVGKALPEHELRIAEPNEEGVGEIEVRGPSVMKGYFRNEAATAECFDGEGWFRTGDLGKMDSDGYVTITGRKKSLIVNREGKNIYPEEVEIAINACPHILESIVLGYRVPGEAKGEHVGAIVVADLDKIAEERNRNAASSSSPMSDDEVRALCISEVHEAMKQLSSYKHPRRIRVRFEPLQKTNTLKVKRYLYSLDSDEEA